MYHTNFDLILQDLLWEFGTHPSEMAPMLDLQIRSHHNVTSGTGPVQHAWFLRNELKISDKLSQNCQDVLHLYLAKDPQQHPSLEQLRLYPWPA